MKKNIPKDKTKFNPKNVLIALAIILGVWLSIFAIDFSKVALTVTPPIFAIREKNCTLSIDFDIYGNCTNCVGTKGCHFRGLGYEIFLKKYLSNATHLIEIKFFGNPVYSHFQLD